MDAPIAEPRTLCAGYGAKDANLDSRRPARGAESRDGLRKASAIWPGALPMLGLISFTPTYELKKVWLHFATKPG